MKSKGTQAHSGPVTYRVVLRRANGRYVRSYPAASKYAAKRLRAWLEEQYDVGYYVETERRSHE